MLLLRYLIGVAGQVLITKLSRPGFPQCRNYLKTNKTMLIFTSKCMHGMNQTEAEY